MPLINAGSAEGAQSTVSELRVSKSEMGCQLSGEDARTVSHGGEGGPAEATDWLGHSQGRPSELVAAGLEALDSLNLGVAVTNSSCQLLLANRTAEQILATGDGLEVTALGVLGTLKRSCNPTLGAVIQQVAQSGQSGNPSLKDAVLAVQRPSGKRPLTLLVRAARGSSSEGDAFRPVLVFMLDAELPIQATEAGLRQLFGLTAREARLAQLLMSGKTLGDCCSHLDIRPSTARMHLGNLFAKTRVQRQGQLISLLFRSVGVVRANNVDRTTSQPGQPTDRNELNRKDVHSNGRAPDTLAAGLQALDLINIGVGVTNGLRQLLFANHTAQQILATRDGLEVAPGGNPRYLEEVLQPALEGALATGCAGRIARSAHATGNGPGGTPTVGQETPHVAGPLPQGKVPSAPDRARGFGFCSGSRASRTGQRIWTSPTLRSHIQ